MTQTRTLALAGAVCAIAVTTARGDNPAVLPWGVDLGFIDKSVAPGNDFFSYANGT